MKRIGTKTLTVRLASSGNSAVVESGTVVVASKKYRDKKNNRKMTPRELKKAVLDIGMCFINV